MGHSVAGLLVVGFLTLLTVATESSAQTVDDRPITGHLKFIVLEEEEPTILMSAVAVWFPLEEYPFDSLGEEGRVRIDPRLLTAYVNFGCRFDGWVRWQYEELEAEQLDNGFVRRRLALERGEQGGFYNNNLKFKCNLLTRSRQVNAYLGTFLTMGQAPVAGFQSAIVQVVFRRMLQQINTLERVPGSWGNFLYETFKSMMTFDLMDDNSGEIDLYFSPEGDRLRYEISRERTVELQR